MADPFDPGSSDPFSHSPGEVIGRNKVLQIDPAAVGFHAGGPGGVPLTPALKRPDSERVLVGKPGETHYHVVDRNRLSDADWESGWWINNKFVSKDKFPGPALSETAEPALEQPAGFEQHMIGQRLPATGKSRASQPQPRLVDVETMRATPAAKGKPPFLERAVDLFRDYPGTPPPWHNLPPEEQLARQSEQIKNNLLFLYDNYPAELRGRASRWYDGGNRIVHERAQQYNLSPRATAGVYAALSPQKDWFENVELGERVLQTVMDPHIRAQPMSPEMHARFAAFTDKPEWVALYNDIAGKSYDQIDAIAVSPNARAELKALWVRLYDDAHRPQTFRVVTPEGQFGDLKRNTDGTPAALRWGTLDFIRNAIRMIETNGTEAETIAGFMHKVRNFYNNLLEPNSTRGDVTIDTHAVAAALLRPLAGKDTEVSHNLATSPPKGQPYAPSSDITGMQGTYGIYADAYRQAAAERGILPRQMQSVTWEAVRGLFTRTYKTPANKKTIDEIWRRYANGQATIEQTRADVLRAAGGINPPDWAGPPRAVPRAGIDDALRYSGDPAELFELRVYGPGAGYPFSGGGVEPAAGPAPGLTEGASTALGAGAE
jgi:hypothetical protein